ncbi:hypothetical protein V6N13_068341 [Hibiscus sabdariffa]
MVHQQWARNGMASEEEPKYENIKCPEKAGEKGLARDTCLGCTEMSKIETCNVHVSSPNRRRKFVIKKWIIFKGPGIVGRKGRLGFN